MANGSAATLTLEIPPFEIITSMLSTARPVPTHMAKQTSELLRAFIPFSVKQAWSLNTLSNISTFCVKKPNRSQDTAFDRK